MKNLKLLILFFFTLVGPLTTLSAKIDEQKSREDELKLAQLYLILSSLDPQNVLIPSEGAEQNFLQVVTKKRFYNLFKSMLPPFAFLLSNITTSNHLGPYTYWNNMGFEKNILYTTKLADCYHALYNLRLSEFDDYKTKAIENYNSAITELNGKENKTSNTFLQLAQSQNGLFELQGIEDNKTQAIENYQSAIRILDTKENKEYNDFVQLAQCYKALYKLDLESDDNKKKAIVNYVSAKIKLAEKPGNGYKDCFRLAQCCEALFELQGKESDRQVAINQYSLAAEKLDKILRWDSHLGNAECGISAVLIVAIGASFLAELYEKRFYPKAKGKPLPKVK